MARGWALHMRSLALFNEGCPPRAWALRSRPRIPGAPRGRVLGRGPLGCAEAPGARRHRPRIALELSLLEFSLLEFPLLGVHASRPILLGPCFSGRARAP